MLKSGGLLSAQNIQIIQLIKMDDVELRACDWMNYSNIMLTFKVRPLKLFDLKMILVH